MVRSKDDDQHNDSKNHRMPSRAVRVVWVSRTVGLRQWTTVQQRRILELLVIERSSTCQITSVPSTIEWCGRALGANVQRRNEVNERRAWRHCYKIATISVPVPLHAACDDWYLTISAVLGAYSAHEVVNVAPGFGRESACQAGEAAEFWAPRSASI